MADVILFALEASLYSLRIKAFEHEAGSFGAALTLSRGFLYRRRCGP
jgi:hypothetical protein